MVIIMNKVYDIVNKKIIEELEKGVIPWRKPWNAGIAPQNLITKKAYNGINTILLSNLPYKSPYYASFKQIQQKGGQVIKGEHGHIVIFWLIGLKTKDGKPVITNGKQEKTFSPRYYKVFNTEQTTLKIDIPVIKKANPIESAEKIVTEYKSKPKIVEKNINRAYYTPALDIVTMPVKEQFEDINDFYQVLFHELNHSTGHEKRLDRFSQGHSHNFGSVDYSKEELIAEMGSAFLCAIAGIENDIKNTASYIKSWLQALKDDNKMLISASQKAQKSVDYITNNVKEYK